MQSGLIQSAITIVFFFSECEQREDANHFFLDKIYFLIVWSFLGNVSFVKSATVFRYLFVVLNHPKLQTEKNFQEFNDATSVTRYYDRSKLYFSDSPFIIFT